MTTKKVVVYHATSRLCIVIKTDLRVVYFTGHTTITSMLVESTRHSIFFIVLMHQTSWLSVGKYHLGEKYFHTISFLDEQKQ